MKNLDMNLSYWYELQDKGSDFFLSLDDPTELESLFPTVLLPIDVDKGGALTYDLKEWKSFDVKNAIYRMGKENSRFNFWIPLYVGLRFQLRTCLCKNYMGYQIFTYKKKHPSQSDRKEEKASFGSWIFDAPNDMFDAKGLLKKNIQSEIASNDIAFISSVLLSKDTARQVLFYWGKCPRNYNGYAVRLIVAEINGEIHCNFDMSTNRQKKLLKTLDLEDEKRRVSIEHGLGFMLTNSFQASRQEKRFSTMPQAGGVLYTPTLYKGNNEVASATLVFYGGGQISGGGLALNEISSITRSWGLKLETVVRLILEKDRMSRDTRRILGASVRAAIGSIMSRNGSHNLGSHVLAALADNVGTMPDDKVLYQYIQHRMDYIATATTDFPAWRQPTMFLGSMMKTFLSQRHLLDNIAGSEGLRAWKFQGRNANKRGDVATIKFHIRKNENGRIVELLKYDCDGGKMLLDGDVSIAVPGGTVGQHAFFTIIENVIRNAAKHDWSSPPLKTRKIKFRGKDIIGNLEVFIDFKDIPEEGNVEFTIFTNMSDANDVEADSHGKTTLFKSLSKALNMQFIDEEGKMRKENWGIAEMKISAGYLQGREPDVIGGLDGTSNKASEDATKFGKDIIAPTKIKIGRIYHLGYKFKVPKSRTLLVVVNNEPKNLDDKIKRELASHGVYIASSKNAARSNADNSFEFVLMDSFTKERLNWRLPFRVVCMDLGGCCERTRNHVAELLGRSEKNTDEIATILAERCGDENYVSTLITDVCASWSRYLKKIRGINALLNLVVSTEINKSSHSGQSLVNASAAVRFVFEEGISKAVESFYRLKKRSTTKESIKVWREADRAIRHISNQTQALDASICQSDAGIRQLLIKQISLWLTNYDKDKIPSVWAYIVEVRKGSYEAHRADTKTFVDHPFKMFIDYLVEVCSQAKGYLGQYAEEIATLPGGFSTEPKRGESSPRLFKGEEKWDAAGLNICIGDVELKNGDVIEYYRHFIPRTGREDTNDPPQFVTDPFCDTKNLYVEPLSGTQSYLTQLQSLSELSTVLAKVTARRLLQAKLVECALLRILIIDERVSRFVKNHSDLTLATFALMNISVADDKLITDELESKEHEQKPLNGNCFAETLAYTPRGLVKLDACGVDALRTAIMENNKDQIDSLKNRYQAFKDKFDILIIHQGILDKWFKGLVNDGKKMSDLYDSFKKVFPYVIITTGRGTPANIPNMARVLPFSTIETTLFRKYPEKLVLVDAIMNILPIRR